MLAIYLYFYYANIKDAYAMQCAVEQGKKPRTLKDEMRSMLDDKFYKTALFVPIIGVCIFNVLPIVFMILIAFTNYGPDVKPPVLIDWKGFESFIKVLTLGQFAPTFFKILLWNIVWAVLSTALNYFCGLGIALLYNKKCVRGKAFWRMFPSFMAMTAVYLLMTQFNLINSHWGLILIYSAGAPMGYMTQKGFFDTIPKSIDEAARIDGATNAQVFLRITLPLASPMIVYTLLSSFVWPWSDFILPQLLLKEKDLYTVAVGLMSLGDDEFARFAAGSMFIGVPIIVMYFALSKFLISGLSAGAVKD